MVSHLHTIPLASRGESVPNTGEAFKTPAAEYSRQLLADKTGDVTRYVSTCLLHDDDNGVLDSVQNNS
jgi:hypothetical protein